MPDNANVAVIKTCLYEPIVNRSYSDMAQHYHTAILAARPRHPTDKAKVEACVGIIERWRVGRLRNPTFYNLAERNDAIAEWLAKLNDGPVLRQYGRTRRQPFKEIDAPNLKPLPGEPWVHSECRRYEIE
ncbi:hypothetical protein [Bradyrhizobium cytisi]|uniref:hypothetical protein n=1 Tax=Bradyrhizobium cytisi TaxID=515489 RepID=UPI001FE4A818|nr:hypothetical protein [Bradyrhizobium cytisi]